MATVKMLIGYRGARTNEQFLAPGMVVKMTDGLARDLVEMGKAEIVGESKDAEEFDEREDFTKLTVVEIKERLAALDLSVKGNKDELLARLIANS